jgi:hypothetical protein
MSNECCLLVVLAVPLHSARVSVAGKLTLSQLRAGSGWLEGIANQGVVYLVG